MGPCEQPSTVGPRWQARRGRWGRWNLCQEHGQLDPACAWPETGVWGGGSGPDPAGAPASVGPPSMAKLGPCDSPQTWLDLWEETRFLRVGMWLLIPESDGLSS